jgi:hypothetical protein
MVVREGACVLVSGCDDTAGIQMNWETTNKRKMKNTDKKAMWDDGVSFPRFPDPKETDFTAEFQQVVNRQESGARGCINICVIKLQRAYEL